MGANQEIIAELRRVLNERDEAREQLYLTKAELGRWVDRETKAVRERDEWRDKFFALNQTAGELCNACGWAFKIPGESCRCEVVKERDEARASAADQFRRGAEAMRARCEEIASHACSVIGKLEHTYGIMTQGHIETVSRLILEADIPEEP